ncbi:MAG TPA: DUF3857 and transglutaminase domain-containing protein [Thermoanaerobaculia bacterium]|nr:DUF3857 and transglutaminase domain-containing protein [Thermoanaerobaculia bacterium]
MIRRIASLAVLLCVASTSAFAWGGAPDWLKALAHTQLPKYADDTAGAALLDETVVTVTRNGELHTLHRTAYKVLTTAGRDLGYIAVHYDKENALTGFRAWAIAANGEEYQVKERDAVETAAFDGELYADAKVKVLRIPAAEPGAIVAYEIEQTRRPYGLQDVWQYQSTIPVRRARYSLTLPEGWSQEARWLNAPALAPRTENGALVWELSDVDAIKPEPGMPAMRSLAGALAVTLVPPVTEAALRPHRTWADVGAWYEALSASRRTATPALQAKARELTASKATTLEKIAAIAAFAQRDVRYVAIEIGIGNVQPHAAADVFANRYGDCKDKVTLLVTMLKEIGVKAHPLLVHTDRGVANKDYASIRWFNHVIAAIELPADAPAEALYATVKHEKLGRLLFFDPTSPNTPFGHLPPYLQASRGLLVASGTGELIELAAQAPESSQLLRSAKLKLDDAGALAGEVREVRTGAIATNYRDALQSMTEKERQQFVEQQLNYHLNHFTLRDLAVENLDDPAKDLVIHYTLAAPSYARTAAGLLLVRPRVLGRKTDAIIDLKNRKYGYEMSGPSREVDDIEIAMPANVIADELPPAQNLSTPVVSYTSQSTFEKNALHYRREYKVQNFDVPLAGLADLNKAFSQVLADERTSAVLRAVH